MIRHSPFVDLLHLYPTQFFQLISLWKQVFQANRWLTTERLHELSVQFLQGESVKVATTHPTDVAVKRFLCFLQTVLLESHRQSPFSNSFKESLRDFLTKWLSEEASMRQFAFDRLEALIRLFQDASSPSLELSAEACFAPCCADEDEEEEEEEEEADGPEAEEMTSETFFRQQVYLQRRAPWKEFREVLAQQWKNKPSDEFVALQDWLVPELISAFDRRFVYHVILSLWFRVPHSINIERFSFAVLQFAAIYNLTPLIRWTLQIGRLMIHARDRCLPFLAMNLDRMVKTLDMANETLDGLAQERVSWKQCLDAYLRESLRNSNFHWQMIAHVNYRYPTLQNQVAASFTAEDWLQEWIVMRGTHSQQATWPRQMFHFAIEYSHPSLLTKLVLHFDQLRQHCLSGAEDMHRLQGIFFFQVADWNPREWRNTMAKVNDLFDRCDGLSVFAKNAARSFSEKSLEIWSLRDARAPANPCSHVLLKSLYVVLQLIGKSGPFVLSDLAPYLTARASQEPFCMQRLWIFRLALNAKSLVRVNGREVVAFARRVTAMKREDIENALIVLAMVFVFLCSSISDESDRRVLKNWFEEEDEEAGLAKLFRSLYLIGVCPSTVKT